jgi:hypothetical protein
LAIVSHLSPRQLVLEHNDHRIMAYQLEQFRDHVGLKVLLLLRPPELSGRNVHEHRNELLAVPIKGHQVPTEQHPRWNTTLEAPHQRILPLLSVHHRWFNQSTLVILGDQRVNPSCFVTHQTILPVPAWLLSLG